MIHNEQIYTNINVNVKVPINVKYINEFIGLNCSADLLALKVFPNVKEISESFAAYNAVKNHLKYKIKLEDPSIYCACVGDGNTPRTGATFAFRSKWIIESIDPRLIQKEEYTKIKRLKVINKGFEDVQLPEVNKHVMIHVHSHADIDRCIKQAQQYCKQLIVITIPCCVDHNFKKYNLEYYKEYNDRHIYSPKNTVKIAVFPERI